MSHTSGKSGHNINDDPDWNDDKGEKWKCRQNRSHMQPIFWIEKTYPDKRQPTDQKKEGKCP